jgi:1-acyl-sn-glycerol-3-phosphate acyltransferase
MLLRSVLFNIAFYLNTVICLVIALPTFFMPYRAIVWVAKTWGRINLVLLRVICGLKADFRGIGKIPRGAALIAAKHQSAWETFALLWMFEDPTFILKRELQWIPLFGWFTIKGRMIPVDRGARSQGLTAMSRRAADRDFPGRNAAAGRR